MIQTMFWILLLDFAVFSAVEGRELPCDTVPDNGKVEITAEGVYIFTCESSSYTLIGESSARCKDGVFNIHHLPTCVKKTPRKTSVTARYKNFICEEEAIERRTTALIEVLKEAKCWEAGTCTIKETSHECNNGELIIQVQFDTLTTEAHNNIEAVTDAMKQKHKANRQKRFDFNDFDDATTDDIDTSGCSAGYITNLDNTCTECQAGTYASEEGTSCLLCPIGMYQPSSAATSCIECEEGTTTESAGSEELGECIGTCQLPDVVHNGVYKVDYEEQEAGASVMFGRKVILSCNDGYKFDNAANFEMSCESPASTFYNTCYKVAMLPDENIYQLQTETAYVTCSAETPHDIIGFHLVHDNKFNVVAGGDREFEDGVAKQIFRVTSAKGAVGKIKCMADVMEDFFETSNDEITVALVDVSIKPAAGMIANVGEAVTITALVSYDDLIRAQFSWKKNGETYRVFSDSQSTIGGSQFFQSEVVFESVRFDDQATYSVTVKVTDPNGNPGLVKEKHSALSVRGFMRHPSDDIGRTYIVHLEGHNVKLTCTYQGMGESDALLWVDESNKVIHKEWQTSEEEEEKGVTTNIIQFEEWPEDVHSDKLKCAVFNGADLLVESQRVILISHGYEVQMGSDVHAVPGEDAQLECTASSPEDLEHPPTVTWYKKNIEGEDIFLEDGHHFITNNKLDGTILESVLTVSEADKEDGGEYYCKAQYDKPVYIEILGKDSVELSLAGTECDISQHDIENGRIVNESVDGGKIVYTVECNPGYWLSKGSGNQLYCDDDGSVVYPHCERVIIKANIVKHNDEGHLLKVSYESNSWNGNGTLCDDGWDDRAADIICKQNGFLHGKAASLTADEEDFVLTELNCPCGEIETLEHCSAARYEESELPCLPEEAAGVRCYNESLINRVTFLNARSTRKAYKLSMKIMVLKFGRPLGLRYLDSSSFTLTSDLEQSVELEIRKAIVKLQEDSVYVKLVARKPKGYKTPKSHCIQLGIEGPFQNQTFQQKYCFK